MPSPVAGHAEADSSAAPDPPPQISESQEDPGAAPAQQSDASQSDALAESKERARAVVAASATPTVQTPNDDGQNATGTPVDSERANGSDKSVAGRKRSRSGSRRSNMDSKPLPGRTKEQYKAWQLEEYLYREQVHKREIKEGTIKSEKIQSDSDDRLNWYSSWYQADNPLLHRRQAPGTLFGSGYRFNVDTPVAPNSLPNVVLPAHCKRPNIRWSRTLRQSKKTRKDQADQPEELVPIRLDIELDKIRLRDTFTWNLHDRNVQVAGFAQRLVEDFGIMGPQAVTLIQLVRQSIEEQLQDYHPHVMFHDEPVDPHLPYIAYKDDELRILVKLNITVGPHTLMDQFEWDINNPPDAPEEFARHMAQELALSGEFTTAIAHSIREQCQLFTKSLYVIGHSFDGRPVDDHEVAASFQPSPMPSVFRPHQAAKEYTPYLYDLNEADIEKTELSVSREERAQKRSVNRRGGPTLPDLKTRPKTLRTLLVHSVLPGAVENVDDSRLFKKVQVIQRPKRGRGNDESEDDSSDDSATEAQQPTPSGTARTRARGAPNIRETALRNAAGRSVTPATAYRESSSPEPTSLIVKLKISRAMFQQIERNRRSRNRDHRPDSSHSPAKPAPGSSMGPPTGTPRSQPGTLPGASNSPAPTKSSGANLGRVAAAGHPDEGHAIPSPPAALIKSLEELQKDYPNDLFEPFMRLTAVSDETGEPISLKAGLPPNASWYYYPRIRCKDCPGKLYTPDATLGASNFEVHLKNKQHKQKVSDRVAKTGGKAG